MVSGLALASTLTTLALNELFGQALGRCAPAARIDGLALSIKADFLNSPRSTRPRRRRTMQHYDDVDSQSQSRLCALEDHLLVRIFSHARDSSYANPSICKKLSPIISVLLHSTPVLRTARQLVALCHHLEREPAWLVAVRALSLGERCDFPLPSTPGMHASSASARGRRLQLPSRAEVEKSTAHGQNWIPPSFISGRLVAGPELVQDLLRAVPLKQLQIDLPAVATAILTREYLESGPLPVLVELDISPQRRPDEALGGALGQVFVDLVKPVEPARQQERGSHSLSFTEVLRLDIASLAHLPALEYLSLGGLAINLGPELLNLRPDVALSPRSLKLKDFALPTSFFVTGELRNLAAALAVGLQTFELDVLVLLTSLDDILLRLPPTLVHLKVRLGRSTCPSAYKSSSAGTISATALDLPNLVSLELKGDIVSASTLTGIERLEQLERLALGEHTQYDLAALLALLPRPDTDADADPPTSPRPLRRLALNICACPPDEEDLVRSKPGSAPRWPRGFGAHDARELLREAGARGVELEGSVRCAAGACEGGGEGSACAVWCGT